MPRFSLTIGAEFILISGRIGILLGVTISATDSSSVSVSYEEVED